MDIKKKHLKKIENNFIIRESMSQINFYNKIRFKSKTITKELPIKFKGIQL